MEALGLVLKERNRIQYLDSKVYQGKERKQKQLEHERRKKRQQNERQLLMRYRELDIIKNKTEFIQFKINQLKSTAARNFKRKDSVHPVMNLPFLCIASSDPLPVLKNQDGTAMCIQVPDKCDIKIETELAFINRLNIREAMRDPTQFNKKEPHTVQPVDQSNFLFQDPLVSQDVVPLAEVREVSVNLLGQDRAQQNLLAFSPYPGNPDFSMGTPSPGLIYQRELEKIHGISDEEKKEREYIKQKRELMDDIFGRKELKDEEGNEYIQEYKVKRILKEEYPVVENEVELENLVHINPAHALLQSPAMTQIAKEIHNKYSVKEVKEMTKLKLNKSGAEVSSFKRTFEKMNMIPMNLS